MTSRFLTALACAAIVSVSACSRGGEAATAATGDTVDVFSLAVGDCLSDGVTTGTTVSDMQKISCTSPHDYEVYHVFDLPKGAYPGEDVVDKASDAGCSPAFEAFIGKAYDDSKLGLQSLTPQKDGWDQRDDREVVCLIVDADEKKLTGSMRGSRL